MPPIRRFAAAALLITAAALAVPFAAGQPKRASQQPMVYELRTYTTVPGRLQALHARFKNHTMRLFEKHGMKNVIYWTPADKENTLVYVLAHKSVEDAKKSFDAFRKDPEWIKARDESERDGKIVEKVESQFLTPTEYSPIK